jgi:hypothetical protein
LEGNRVSAHRNDIVVWCSHGEVSEFVQRYRWMTSQGVWVPVDLTGESNSFVGDDPPAGATPEVIAASIPRPQDFSARCKKCLDKVPMRYGGAQVALTRLSGLGQTSVSMPVLRHAYNEVPKQLR